MVDVDSTLCALLALVPQPIDHGAAVVAPCGVEVGDGAEFVGDGVLGGGDTHIPSVPTCANSVHALNIVYSHPYDNEDILVL